MHVRMEYLHTYSRAYTHTHTHAQEWKMVEAWEEGGGANHAGGQELDAHAIASSWDIHKVLRFTMHACMHACMHMYTHIPAHISIQLCPLTSTETYMHIYKYAPTHKRNRCCGSSTPSATTLARRRPRRTRRSSSRRQWTAQRCWASRARTLRAWACRMKDTARSCSPRSKAISCPPVVAQRPAACIYLSPLCVCLCVCACVRVRVCVRACVCVCVCRHVVTEVSHRESSSRRAAARRPRGWRRRGGGRSRRRRRERGSGDERAHGCSARRCGVARPRTRPRGALSPEPSAQSSQPRTLTASVCENVPASHVSQRAVP